MNTNEKVVLREISPLLTGIKKPLSENAQKNGKRLHEIQIQTLESIDNQIGKLLKKISRKKPILIVICGDHGELFGEKGKWGHIQNEKEVLTVPLLINLKL